tara:strand:- start:17 stop:334 length:318 start_codon:yes stop_codon:yes gene_type:complete
MIGECVYYDDDIDDIHYDIQDDIIVEFKKVQKEGLELFEKKNKDYGDAFKQDGTVGVLIRMGDKINRLKHITKNKVEFVDNETMRDTLIDLHNYSAMAIMLINKN